MKKLFALFLALLLLCSCGIQEEPIIDKPQSEPEKQEESKSEEKEEMFFISIAADESFEKPFFEKTEEKFSPVLIKPEEIIMSEDKQEIYEKYIAPIDNPMPLHTEFSEDFAPKGIYTYIFQQCRGLDEKVLGITNDYSTMAAEGESFWVDGGYAEETIKRWFGWEPEDYREYFEYDAEKNMYLMVACGGGPVYHYVTDYKMEGDTLYVSYSAYYEGPMDSNFPEMEYLFVYYKGIAEIKIEERGWKYVSNKKVYSEEFPTWHNKDFGFTAKSVEYEYPFKEEFRITKGSEVSKLVISGPIYREFYMSDFPVGIFVTEGGIVIFDFEKENIRTITNLPTKYDGKHNIITAFMDDNNNIIVAYVKKDYNPYASPIEIVVLDYGSLSVINYIDTGTNPQKTYSIRLEEIGKIIIKYPDFGRMEVIKYLEEPLNPIEMPKIQENPKPLEDKNNPAEKTEEKVFSDPVLKKLTEIFRTSENYIEETVSSGYTCYSTEKAYGYENLLDFAKAFPKNKEENYYITEIGTGWKVYKIEYLEEGGWLFVESSGNMKSFPISEIKIYGDRITFYFDEGKKVFYKNGSELGLPINNCSHPAKAHYIDIEIIRYINSNEFRSKYEKTHSEPYLDFDEYTKTLYSEEEKCLINIYHYIEHYGLCYDDFVSAYGSEERIEEIWGDADIKGYFK